MARVETETIVQAKHLPQGTLKEWDTTPSPEESVKVDVVLDYVPLGEEQGGTWDEVVSSGGHLEHVWLDEGDTEPETVDLLTFLTGEERRSLEDEAQHIVNSSEEW